jgi:hypothetical protein
MLVTSVIERFVSNGVLAKRKATSEFDEFAKLANSDYGESNHVKSEARVESSQSAHSANGNARTRKPQRFIRMIRL